MKQPIVTMLAFNLALTLLVAGCNDNGSGAPGTPMSEATDPAFVEFRDELAAGGEFYHSSNADPLWVKRLDMNERDFMYLIKPESDIALDLKKTGINDDPNELKYVAVKVPGSRNRPAA